MHRGDFRKVSSACVQKISASGHEFPYKPIEHHETARPGWGQHVLTGNMRDGKEYNLRYAR
jgi:hypothetical protein